MKNTIKQVFHSGKFLCGFIIFVLILIICILYPIFVTYDPLEMVGNGNFYKPGTYISQEEAALNSGYALNMDASESRLATALGVEELAKIQEYLVKYANVPEKDIDVTDIEGMVELWQKNYDPDLKAKGLTSAKRKSYRRLDSSITAALKDSGVIIAEADPETGELKQEKKIKGTSYVNTKDIVNKRTFILGTDNFGRDVLTELVAATIVSLRIGLVAGLIATAVGLILGLLAGYMGGLVDNIIMFLTNLFTVIPSFIILILVSYSIGTNARGVMMVAVIIGLTSWPWTTRSR